MVDPHESLEARIQSGFELNMEAKLVRARAWSPESALYELAHGMVMVEGADEMSLDADTYKFVVDELREEAKQDKDIISDLDQVGLAALIAERQQTVQERVVAVNEAMLSADLTVIHRRKAATSDSSENFFYLPVLRVEDDSVYDYPQFATEARSGISRHILIKDSCNAKISPDELDDLSKDIRANIPETLVGTDTIREHAVQLLDTIGGDRETREYIQKVVIALNDVLPEGKKIQDLDEHHREDYELLVGCRTEGIVHDAATTYALAYDSYLRGTANTEDLDACAMTIYANLLNPESASGSELHKLGVTQAWVIEQLSAALTSARKSQESSVYNHLRDGAYTTDKAIAMSRQIVEWLDTEKAYNENEKI